MQHVWKPGYGSLPRELLGLFPQVLKFGVVPKNTDTNDTRQHGCTLCVYVVYSLCMYTE